MSKPIKNEAHRSIAKTRRAGDGDEGRRAQFAWMVGVGLLVALLGIYQNLQPVEARPERGPAQLAAPNPPDDRLPYFEGHSKEAR
ncbi:MAG: hypothetical protein RJB38_1520 [Pseudomonadota bacterium]|jgi:hypothetical protein